MQIKLGPQSAYLVKTPAGAVHVCDCLAMLNMLVDAIAADGQTVAISQVHELRPTLRFRMLPKREIRALAAAAHAENNLSLSGSLAIDFWYK